MSWSRLVERTCTECSERWYIRRAYACFGQTYGCTFGKKPLPLSNTATACPKCRRSAELSNFKNNELVQRLMRVVPEHGIAA